MFSKFQSLLLSQLVQPVASWIFPAVWKRLDSTAIMLTLRLYEQTEMKPIFWWFWCACYSLCIFSSDHNLRILCLRGALFSLNVWTNIWCMTRLLESNLCLCQIVLQPQEENKKLEDLKTLDTSLILHTIFIYMRLRDLIYCNINKYKS